MRTWTPPLLILATLATIAWKPKPMLKLAGYVLLASALLAASTALCGWLFWEAILYLIRHAR